MIHPLRQLKVNQRGRIEPLGGPSSNGAEGVVRAITDQAILLELSPAEALPELEVGQRVTFKYWDLFGLHRGETQVTSHSPTDPMHVAVAPPTELELTQKRKFYRVHVDMQVGVSLRATDEHPAEELKVATDDLTPAGMRFRSTRVLPIGEKIRVRIDPLMRDGEKSAPILAEARVVRAEGAGANEGDSAHISVEFVGISEAEQVRVALLLFEVQRRA